MPARSLSSSLSYRFTGGTIFTGIGNPLQNSLTVRNGLVAQDTDPVDETIELNGGCVLPAFVDAHCHPSLVAEQSRGPNLLDVHSLEGLYAQVGKYASKQNWVVGFGYDRSLAPDGAFLATWLDEHSVDANVVLHASDQHTIWANSKAIAAANITAEELQTTTGIDLDDQGQPAGTFREAAAKALILRAIPQQTTQDFAQALHDATGALRDLGIKATLDAWIGAQSIAAASSIKPAIELHFAQWISPESTPDFLAGATFAKFFLDGTLGNGTACVIDEYLHSEHAHGEALWTDAQLTERVKAAAAAGKKIHMHTIGDAAVEQALRVIKGLNLPSGLASLVHAELLTDGQIRELASSQIAVCVQPLWARVDELSIGALNRMSDGQKARLYRYRDMLDAGVFTVFGSDWPVSSANPLEGMQTAITRRLEGAPALNEPQAISLEEAIFCYTQAPAEFLGLSGSGRLEVGHPADLVVLDGDPFADQGKTVGSHKVTALLFQ